MMNMNNQSCSCSTEHIHGITCDVTNCHYNEVNSHACTADTIKVGPQFAASSADTVCATFKPKS